VEPQYPKHKGNSKLDEYANTLTSWLHRESHRKRKQRLSVKQLFYNLVQLGYTGSYDRVAAFARDWLLFLDGEYVDRPDGTTRFRTRYHGVFAPSSQHCALVTPARRGRGNKATVVASEATPVASHAAMSWAQRLKRLFNIDIEDCGVCGGSMKVIACIEDPLVIK